MGLSSKCNPFIVLIGGGLWGHAPPNSLLKAACLLGWLYNVVPIK